MSQKPELKVYFQLFLHHLLFKQLVTDRTQPYSRLVGCSSLKSQTWGYPFHWQPEQHCEVEETHLLLKQHESHGTVPEEVKAVWQQTSGLFVSMYYFDEERGRPYLRRLSPRSELPDLLRCDSWSDSEESERGKHRLWSGLTFDIRWQRRGGEGVTQESRLTIRRWSGRWCDATRGRLPHSDWAGFHLRQDSERHRVRQINVMDYDMSFNLFVFLW